MLPFSLKFPYSLRFYLVQLPGGGQDEDDGDVHRPTVKCQVGQTGDRAVPPVVVQGCSIAQDQKLEMNYVEEVALILLRSLGRATGCAVLLIANTVGQAGELAMVVA